VRTRAGVPTVTSITTTSLRNERRIELAFEGQYWFDLVRLSYYNPDEAIKILNDQIKEKTPGDNTSMPRTQFSYDPGTGIEKPSANGMNITPPTIATFTLPIPANDQTADPKLLEPPVAYYK
jgi:hypothetical protein